MNIWIKRMSLCLAFLLTMSSCSAQELSSTAFSPLEIAGAVIQSQEGLADLHTLQAGEDAFSTYLSEYYALEESLLQDGVVCYVGGTDASEITVLAVRDDTDTREVEDALLQYIENRIADFYGYMPDQVLVLENASVITSGNYVAMLICAQPDPALAAFSGCFSDELPAEADPVSVRSLALQADADAQWDFNSDAVLAAWRSGDTTDLSDKDRRILDACARVIDEVVSDGMSDYQKELAIHDWIIDWAEYDAETKNHAPDARPEPDNENPYGLLIGQRAICTGYAHTFQLFMDMLDIECITVYGTSRRGSTEHVWNMVNLDEGWYCVDITWDDPLSPSKVDDRTQHKYFNVTSAFMRESDHQWDEKSVPEARGIQYRWQPPGSI